MSTTCVCVFHVNLLQDSTNFVCVFRMTLLRDVHKACLCVPLHSNIGYPQNVFLFSKWLFCRIPTNCVCVFLLTTLQDIYKMCLCVPYDSPAWCPQSAFMCSTLLSCRISKNVFMCSIWLSCRMSTKCVYVFHMTLLQNVSKEYLCVMYYCHYVQASQNSPTVFVKGKFCFFCKVPYGY
jgi:hypothetical protein